LIDDLSSDIKIETNDDWTIVSGYNLDGQSMARATASGMAELYENSPVSPAANGLAFLDINGGFTAS